MGKVSIVGQFMSVFLPALLVTSAAVAESPRNECEIQISAAGIKRLDPLIYMHLNTLQTLLTRLPKVKVEMQVSTEDSQENALFEKLLEEVGTPLSRLPTFSPGGRFVMRISDGAQPRDNSLTVMGYFSWAPSPREHLRVLSLSFLLENMDISEPLSDLKLLGLALSVSLAGSADLVSLNFRPNPSQAQDAVAKIKDIKQSHPADILAALNYPALTQIAATFPFTLSYIDVDTNTQGLEPSISVELNTNKEQALANHIENLLNPRN